MNIKNLCLLAALTLAPQYSFAESNLINNLFHSASSCSISNQSGSVDAMCGYETPIRCYAEVEFSSGAKGTIYGSECWPDLSYCFSTGQGAVDPCDD